MYCLSEHDAPLTRTWQYVSPLSSAPWISFAIIAGIITRFWNEGVRDRSAAKIPSGL